jgi:hypothetical protein
MGLLVFASDHWVLASSPFWMRLVCNVTLGAVSYLLLIRHFRLEAFKDVGQVLKDRGADRNRFIRWLLRT